MLNFVIVGAQKSGTSALDNYLRQHPEVMMGREKELHFFDDEKVFENTPVDYSILEDSILSSPSGKVKGECTPIYMYWNPSIKRIWEYNPEIKILAILRNPIERAFSQWNMNRVKKVNKFPDFYSCLVEENENRFKEDYTQHRKYSCIDRGFYSRQIQKIWKYFKKEQVLFLKYEEFRANQLVELTRVFNFIGVNADLFEYKYEKKYVLEYNEIIKEKEKEYLLNIYMDEIGEVERTLGWNCDDWRM